MSFCPFNNPINICSQQKCELWVERLVPSPAPDSLTYYEDIGCCSIKLIAMRLLTKNELEQNL